MSTPEDISPLAVNRLSVYLRCLRNLWELGEKRISSKELARRFNLSAPQIRKDLAHFGELGIRGVGYEIEELKSRLESLLGIQHQHPTVIVGAGNIGTALTRFPGLRTGSFRILAIFDNDPEKIGRRILDVTVRHSRELARVVAKTRAQIGILAVPAEAAQENADALIAAGIQAILNFAPVQLQTGGDIRVKNVDLLIFLEELAFFLK